LSQKYQTFFIPDRNEELIKLSQDPQVVNHSIEKYICYMFSHCQKKYLTLVCQSVTLTKAAFKN